MKKITFIIINSILFYQFLIGQTLNQDALWPNSSWTVEGTYDSSEITDPTISANFSYNDDAAGGNSTDEIQVQSPTIDLTAASNAGETWIEVVHSYNYYLGTSFTLEYYDADTASWILWNNLPENSSTTNNWCGNLTPNTSSILDIGSFTASQLTGFRYRFNYNASSVWGYGVCTSSPTITSQADPSLGVDDNSISLLNYFPNPVSDVLTIKAQKDVDNITVYNMLGQVVKRQTPNTRDCTVDLSAMQTGAYFVQVSIDNSIETVRILKN